MCFFWNLKLRFLLFILLLLSPSYASALTIKSGETISSSSQNEIKEAAPIGERPAPSADLMRDAACLALEDGTAKQLQESYSELRKKHKDQRVVKIGIDLFVDLDGDAQPELATIYHSNTYERYFDKNISIVSANTRLNTDKNHGLRVAIEQPKSKEIRKIISGDINGDGKNDIAFIDYGEHDTKLHDGKIILLVSNDTGHEWKEIIPKPNKLRIHTGAFLDIDNDNDLDLVIGAVGNGKNRLYSFKNDGKGNYSQTSNLKSVKKFGYGWSSYNATDLDKDGYHDLITDWLVKGHISKGLQILWGSKKGVLKKLDILKIESDLLHDKDVLMSALPYTEDGEQYLLAVFANYIGMNKILKLRFEGRELKSIEKIRDRSLIFSNGFGWANTIYPCGSGLKFFHSKIYSYKLSSNVTNWN